MSVAHLEFLVEEPSMEVALRLILPNILNAMTFEVYPHQCKDELLARLPERLRGYAQWLPPTWRVVVVIDRDNDDCTNLKGTLEGMAADAGLLTRSIAANQSYAMVTRLAIEELEAWYFGDWDAVQAAYPRVQKTIPTKARYRDPDAIVGGTWEAFERILQRAGYYRGGLRKIEAARLIAPQMRLQRNTSRSFHALREVLVELAHGSNPA